ncbi:MAG: type III-A CRISPR-associated RAMP protein Csm5 [bacterium]|nr:type III-A CRISPR-associated RAMP protein Csm5 [bacterium]
MEKPLRVRLHILSPVHIGCDEVYEPTGFVIDKKKARLIAFDPLNFMESLSSEDKQRFAQICMKGDIPSILEIYKFIASKSIEGREIEIASDLLSHYEKVMRLDKSEIKQKLNQFAISRTTYNPYNNTPYIPGSSLKGSLRTAYLSKLARDKGIKNWNSMDNKGLEKNLLGGSFDSDPFCMVKPSDFSPVGNAGTKILYAVNKKKKSGSDAKGPFQILETIKPNAIFEGMININQPVNKIRNPINKLLEFINSVNGENEIIREIGGDSVVKKIKEQFHGKIGSSTFILRIGRHSGAEAVTVEGNRQIKINQGKKPTIFLDHATTIWLASETSKPSNNNGLVPFGWVVLEIL